MPDIGSDLDEFLLQTTDSDFHFRIRCHLPPHLAQPERERSDLLKNAVVQLSGDAHPLCLLRFDHTFIEGADLDLMSLQQYLVLLQSGLLPFQGVDAKTINRPEHRHKCEHTARWTNSSDSPTNSLTSELFGLSTETLASSLGSGRAFVGFNPLYQIGGPRSIQLALKLQF